MNSAWSLSLCYGVWTGIRCFQSLSCRLGIYLVPFSWTIRQETVSLTSNQRTVVVLVLVCEIPGLPGVETSVPLVSFSIITPFGSALRRVVVVTSTSCVGATPGVITVVELEAEDCAKPPPDINVRPAAAISKVLNITRTPTNHWRAKSLSHAGSGPIEGGAVNTRKIPTPSLGVLLIGEEQPGLVARIAVSLRDRVDKATLASRRATNLATTGRNRASSYFACPRTRRRE